MSGAEQSMSSLKIVRVTAVIATGLTAGILFGDRLGATYGRAVISNMSLVEFQQLANTHLNPVLLPLMIIAAAASMAWVILARPRGSAEFRLALLAAAAVAVALAVTLIVNAPINGALMTWNPSYPPFDVRARWLRWEAAHTWRSVASVAGFALQVRALGAAGGRRD